MNTLYFRVYIIVLFRFYVRFIGYFKGEVSVCHLNVLNVVVPLVPKKTWINTLSKSTPCNDLLPITSFAKVL